MNESIFWVWNGWGILFTGFVAIWIFLHILVSVKLRGLFQLRGLVSLVGIAGVVFTFVLSGWIAGVLSLPIGMTFGVVLAKLVIPR